MLLIDDTHQKIQRSNANSLSRLLYVELIGSKNQRSCKSFADDDFFWKARQQNNHGQSRENFLDWMIFIFRLIPRIASLYTDGRDVVELTQSPYAIALT